MGGDDAEPTAAADALEFGFFVGLDVPDAMEVRAIKHAVIAGGHVAAAAAFGEVGAHGGAFAQVVGDAVGVKHVADHKRMLEVPTVMVLGGFAAFVPQLQHLGFVSSKTQRG